MQAVTIEAVYARLHLHWRPRGSAGIGGIRLLTDPGFDPAGTEFRAGNYVLTRTAGPALDSRQVLPVHAVLLSHDHHFDNLDGSGRRLLAEADRVLTTVEGAARLGGQSTGLSPWDSVPLGPLTVTATPARHGPEGGDRGPVIGFVLNGIEGEGATYVSGDTVLYDGVFEVAQHFDVRRALLFMGAARVARRRPAAPDVHGAGSHQSRPPDAWRKDRAVTLRRLGALQ